MAKTMAGYGLGMGLITLAGIIMGTTGPSTANSTQFNIFLVLLKAYTPLLTPFSSALGLPAIDGVNSYGLLPLITWIAVGALLGALTRSAAGGAKAAFLTAATTLLLWIGSLFFSAPAWPDNLTWLTYVNQMTTGLISRPIDFSSLLILPTASSALSGGIAYILQSKIVKHAKLDEEYNWL